jgi:uncharacterized membrane protein YphA (DoxX/SURF4 family)
MFPQLSGFNDLSLLLLRLMVAAGFVTSGWTHVGSLEMMQVHLIKIH